MRLVSMIILLLVASTAVAQTIWQTNALVVYFDEGATQRSWYGTGPVTAYVVAGPLGYWDGTQVVPYVALEWWLADLYLEPWEHVADVVVRSRGQASPAEIALGPSWWQVEVSFLTPLPLAGLTVIADLELVVLSDQPTEVHALGYGFVADGQENGFATLTSGPDGPMDMTDHVANINAAAPVRSEAATWSDIKGLFR